MNKLSDNRSTSISSSTRWLSIRLSFSCDDRYRRPAFSLLNVLSQQRQQHTSYFNHISRLAECTLYPGSDYHGDNADAKVVVPTISLRCVQLRVRSVSGYALFLEIANCLINTFLTLCVNPDSLSQLWRIWRHDISISCMPSLLIQAIQSRCFVDLFQIQQINFVNRLYYFALVLLIKPTNQYILASRTGKFTCLYCG